MRPLLLALCLLPALCGQALADAAASGAPDPLADVPGCDSDSKSMVSDAYHQGTLADTVNAQTPNNQPPSVFDLSCLDSFLQTSNPSLLFDANQILQSVLSSVAQRVCQAAQSAWGNSRQNPFNPSQLLGGALPNIPGLSVGQGAGGPSVTVVPPDPGNIRVYMPSLPPGVGTAPAGGGGGSSLGNLFR